MAKLRSVKARRGTRHWDYGASYDPSIEKKALNPRRIFDPEREADAFVRAVGPEVETIYHAFGESTAESLGVAYNLRDERVAADLLARSNRLRGVVDTTWEKVQEAILDGEAAGESIDGISKRIGNVFTQAKGYRSRMIARTETIGASNAGSLGAALSSGVVGQKQWLAASDHRTRSSHVSADGQIVAVNRPFQVGAAEMAHPGDPAGGPSETINCRCSMLFIRGQAPEVEGDDLIDLDDFDARAERTERAVAEGKRLGLETHVLHRNPTSPRGLYTEARYRQHEEIIEEFLEAARNVPEEGRAVFSGGLGGAGKGTVLRSDLVDFDPSDFLTIDPDAIKEAMAARGMIPKVPGYDVSPMELSALIHEESSEIAASIARRAMASRKNVIYDITMSSEDSVRKRLDLLARAGYDDVEMVFVDIPVETSVERALSRYREGLRAWDAGEGFGGRYVPPSIIRRQVDADWGSINRRVFESVKDEAQAWKLIDNAGSAPRVVAEKVREEAVEAVGRRTVTRTGVPLAEEMPAGLTKKQAAEWFEGKWGRAIVRVVDEDFDPRFGPGPARWQEVTRRINFESLPKATHEEVLRFLDRLFSSTPAVADRIPLVGTMAWLKGERLLGRIGRGVQGVARRRTFLGTGSKNAAALRQTAEASKAQAWWTTANPMHVYAHEYGHHVHYAVEEVLGSLRGDQALITQEVLAPAFQEVRESLSGAGSWIDLDPTSGIWQNRPFIHEHLSRYAATNSYEVCAEAFAEFVLEGDNARPFAQAVGRRMMDLLEQIEDP